MFKDKRKNKFAKVLLIDSAFAVLTYFAFFEGGGNDQLQNVFQFLVVIFTVFAFVAFIGGSYLADDMDTVKYHKAKSLLDGRFSWQNHYGTTSTLIYGLVMASQDWFVLGAFYVVVGWIMYGSLSAIKESVEKFEQENNQ